MNAWGEKTITIDDFKKLKSGDKVRFMRHDSPLTSDGTTTASRICQYRVGKIYTIKDISMNCISTEELEGNLFYDHFDLVKTPVKNLKNKISANGVILSDEYKKFIDDDGGQLTPIEWNNIIDDWDISNKRKIKSKKTKFKEYRILRLGKPEVIGVLASTPEDAVEMTFGIPDGYEMHTVGETITIVPQTLRMTSHEGKK